MRSVIRRSLFFIATCLVVTLSQAAPALQVDQGKSVVTATAKQIGVPIEGKFKKFTAMILFDPLQPLQAKASVDIDVASYDMGAAEYNKEVTGKDWFNAAKFPTANFVSGSVTAPAPGKLILAGKLTLKGKTVDISVPITVRSEGAIQIFDGILPIRRTQFSIGDGEWKDTSVVADDVLIKFHVVASAIK